jgi:hypothetical protein
LPRGSVSISEEFLNIWNDTGALQDDAIIPPDKKESLRQTLVRIAAELDFLRLTVTKACVDRMLSQITKEITREDIEYFVGDMASRFHDEAAELTFLYIDAEKLNLYGQPHLFGKEVAARFPDSEYDIAEAGNCLALGRNTACVFHCMRVLEYGLSALAKKFKVPFEHTTWTNGQMGNGTFSGASDRSDQNWVDIGSFY